MYISKDAKFDTLKYKGKEYKVIRLLGEGGFKSLFEVEVKPCPEKQTCRKVLGVFKDKKGFDVATNFEEQLRKVAKTGNPFILNPEVIHDEIYHTVPIQNNNEKLNFMVMELANGDLYDEFVKGTLRDNPLLLRMVLEQIEDGLNSMHEVGVAHKDIKSSNILIVGDDLTVENMKSGKTKVVIADFDLIAELHGEGDVTYRGTKGYFPPGEERPFIHDIYSLAQVGLDGLYAHRNNPDLKESYIDKLIVELAKMDTKDPKYEHLKALTVFIIEGIKLEKGESSRGSKLRPLDLPDSGHISAHREVSYAFPLKNKKFDNSTEAATKRLEERLESIRERVKKGQEVTIEKDKYINQRKTIKVNETSNSKACNPSTISVFSTIQIAIKNLQKISN